MNPSGACFTSAYNHGKCPSHLEKCPRHTRQCVSPTSNWRKTAPWPTPRASNTGTSSTPELATTKQVCFERSETSHQSGAASAAPQREFARGGSPSREVAPTSSPKAYCKHLAFASPIRILQFHATALETARNAPELHIHLLSWR